MPKALLSAVVLLLAWCCAGPARAAEPRTWEFAGNGQWPQVQAPGPTTAASTTAPAAVSAPQLDRAEALLTGGSNRAAEKLTIRWLKANKRHPQRDRALYLVARALYQYGNRIRAFYYCDELLDTYPESRFYYPALELQYAIADRYLNGYKRRWLGVPTWHAYEEAVEMLFRVQQRSPGSPLAEKSLLRTADFYFADAQYDFAGDTYAAYIRSYGRSPEIPRARLRQALSSYAQFRGPRFDATPVIDAREQLRSLAATYPELAREENVPALLERIDRDLARKLYLTGDFYRRTNEPRGAAYTFKYLAKAFPQMPEGQRAQDALRKLPQWAVAQAPDPAVMPEFAPGTPPLEPPRMVPAERTRAR
ncbi:MAG TPA: outer membrane protein assembly factor BamD [Tepidisphaeraceae bacterium]|nr:outer membrane protein assembly factor BamD [Tepidisphaeraceae bacterium]